MSLVKRSLVAAALVAATVSAARAQQQPAQPSPPETQPAPAGEPGQPPVLETPEEDLERSRAEERARLRFGVGARLRAIFVPQFVVNLFFDHAYPLSDVGYGLEVVRRKENLDIVFSLQWDDAQGRDGLYLDKGDDPSNPNEFPDFVRFDSTGFISVDAAFMWHTTIVSRLQLRYGAGIGIGWVKGKITQTDTMCPAGTQPDDLDNDNQCTEVSNSTIKTNVPPVLPVVNVTLGLRYDIIDSLTLNVEGGFRDFFFAGAGLEYFF